MACRPSNRLALRGSLTFGIGLDALDGAGSISRVGLPLVVLCGLRGETALFVEAKRPCHQTVTLE